MKVGKLGWLVAMFLSGGMAVAQGTVDDYRRAYALKEKFSADKVFYSNVNPQWIEGTHQFWYVRNTPDGRLYVSVDADKKARKELFDSHRLAKALGAASGKEVKPEALALGRLSVSKGLDTLRFVFNNQRWMYASRKISWSMKVRFPSLSGKSIGWRWMMRRRHHRFRLLMVNGSHLLKSEYLCKGGGYRKRKATELGRDTG